MVGDLSLTGFRPYVSAIAMVVGSEGESFMVDAGPRYAKGEGGGDDRLGKTPWTAHEDVTQSQVRYELG
jgi:hypothetical protein